MKTGIIDYRMGNLHSVKNACDYLGIDAFISADKNELKEADRLILPGVGAFPDAMDALDAAGLTAFIKDRAGKLPLLGICLGMQLLFETGTEVRECRGLGLIGGRVIRISPSESAGKLKIPHMGWNTLEILKPSSRLTAGLSSPSVYFVHSYKAVPADRNDILAVADYGGEVCAATEKGLVFGTQFHPEKSSDSGLAMLLNFSRI